MIQQATESSPEDGREKGSGLDDRERRSLLFGTLLRHAPEAGSLRDTALESLVQIGLLGSTDAEPYRVGRIGDRIREATDGTTTIRQELISASLKRLVARRVVRRVELKKRHAYVLADSAMRGLHKSADEVRGLLDRSVTRLFRDTEVFISQEDATHLFRRFVSECLASIGHSMAKSVTGHHAGVSEATSAEVALICRRLCKEFGVVEAAEIASVQSRCVGFLRSDDPDDEALRFRLCQGYYLSHLLGVDGDAFQPVAAEVFAGATLYLDTNVIIPRVLELPEGEMLDEMAALARRLGATLAVTRATVNEARGVAYDRRAALLQVAEKVPLALVERSEDSFVRAFSTNSQGGSVDEFLAKFDEIPGLLEEAGIQFVDVVEDDVLPADSLAREAAIVSDTAVECRGHGKKDAVVRHDLLHYFLVDKRRQEGFRAWFVTRDRTFVRACERLGDHSVPVAMSMMGTLHSFSPFVATSEESSIARFFGSLLREDLPLLGGGPVFELAELRLIAEFHEDVLAADDEQVLRAFDYVKSTVLQGRRYEEHDHPRVALELRKFLGSRIDEERADLRRQKHKTREAQEKAKAEIEQARERKNLSDSQVQEARSELAAQKAREAGLLRKLERGRWVQGGLVFLAGTLITLSLLYLVEPVVDSVDGLPLEMISFLRRHHGHAAVVVALLALLIAGRLVVSRASARAAAIAVLSLPVLLASGMTPGDQWGSYADVLSTLLVVGTILGDLQFSRSGTARIE